VLDNLGNGHAKPVLVSTGWLAEHLGEPDLVVTEVDENPTSPASIAPTRTASASGRSRRDASRTTMPRGLTPGTAVSGAKSPWILWKPNGTGVLVRAGTSRPEPATTGWGRGQTPDVAAADMP
jgi:hypothetical protein